MSRAKYGPASRARRKRITKMAKGQRAGRSKWHRMTLESLKKALPLRLYATVNEQTIREGKTGVVFEMNKCRVQAAREAKGLPPFPCKDVGLVEYSVFAKTIDPSIKTRCVSCPPDRPSGQFHCAWEFSI